MRRYLATLGVAVATFVAASTPRNADACNTPYGMCLTEGNTANPGGGIYASSINYIGLLGEDSANGVGVLGESDTGYGVEGSSTGDYGVWGYSINSDGVHGDANNSASAVAGYNAGNGSGVWGGSTSGYAGDFTGGTGKLIAGSFYVNGSCQLSCPSDERLKKGIAPLPDAIDTLLKLRGVTFEWKKPEEQGENQTGTQRGFIAQEVEKNFPQWVSEGANGFKTLAIQPTQLAALEVESIRTLKIENDDMRERLKALESGRRPIVSGIDLSGIGFGIGGLAVGMGMFFMSRRKREDARTIASS